jgi:hypothetical protein
VDSNSQHHSIRELISAAAEFVEHLDDFGTPLATRAHIAKVLLSLEHPQLCEGMKEEDFKLAVTFLKDIRYLLRGEAHVETRAMLEDALWLLHWVWRYRREKMPAQPSHARIGDWWHRKDEMRRVEHNHGSLRLRCGIYGANTAEELAKVLRKNGWHPAKVEVLP